MDLIERDITLTCVSNSVGGKYVGGARWLGVRLTDLLDLAGVGSEADQIFATDVDGMTISTPLALATDGRDAMLAIGMNGEVLPREHGFPARVVIPGLYGFISATKWVTRLTLTTYDDKQAYWTERDWATDAPIKISSRIDTPKPLAELDAGREHHRRRRLGPAERRRRQGRRSASTAAPGQDAELGPSAGNDYWRQWFYRWDAELRPAQHRRPGHRRQRQRADHRAGQPVPRGRQRHPGAHRHRRADRSRRRDHRLADQTTHPGDRSDEHRQQHTHCTTDRKVPLP